MGIGSLTAHVDLERSRKQANDLVTAFEAGNAEAFDRIRWNHPRFRGLTDAQIRDGPFVLADAEQVVAGLHYFESWPKLLRHIQSLERQDPAVCRFENAADAIIAGNVASLSALLRDHPALVHERSTRAHAAPLLHYVTANGVEDYRQRSPKNAVDVARMLLDAGAEVDAASNAYGGGSTALGLVSTSTPPRHAGVQIPLIDLLLERGASIDGITAGRSTVRDALANGCPEAARALVDRGAAVPDITVAAGVGRLDLVEKLADGASARDLEQALVAAAGAGDNLELVEFLLDRGADPTAGAGWTALHAATGAADLAVIALLIQRGAPLELKNMYGGTALGQAIWFAFHGDPENIRDYADVIDALIVAGARTDVYPEMQQHIAEVRRRAP